MQDRISKIRNLLPNKPNLMKFEWIAHYNQQHERANIFLSEAITFNKRLTILYQTVAQGFDMLSQGQDTGQVSVFIFSLSLAGVDFLTTRVFTDISATFHADIFISRAGGVLFGFCGMADKDTFSVSSSVGSCHFGQRRDIQNFKL